MGRYVYVGKVRVRYRFGVLRELLHAAWLALRGWEIAGFSNVKESGSPEPLEGGND